MQRKWEAMYYLQKILGFPVVALCLAVPSLASADTIVTTQSYVTDYAVKQHNWANADNGKVLAVNSSGNVVPTNAAGLISGSNTQILQHNGTSWAPTSLGTTFNAETDPDYANKLVTAGTIVSALQKKPSSVANGKVLMYTGTDANANVTADYVKIPNSDPGSGTAPTAFSYIWLQ